MSAELIETAKRNAQHYICVSELSTPDKLAAMNCVDVLHDEIVRLRGEVEQLRVQLAGCGVIAMCNTRESLAKQMPERGAYGWSVSLEDCRNAVEREMALRERLESTAPAMPNGVVRELPAKWLARTPRHADAQAAYRVCAMELQAALRAADNRDAAGVEGNGPDLYSGPHAPCIHPKRPPAAVPAGEAVESAWKTIHVLMSVMRFRPLTSAEQGKLQDAHVAIRTAPPAPVQAAPQEGEDAAEAYRKAWEAGHAAALQHRGDSRGGEGSGG